MEKVSESYFEPFWDGSMMRRSLAEHKSCVIVIDPGGPGSCRV